MHGVHDVVADAQVRERHGDAFLDRAQLDAFGRQPEDLAIAQDVKPQRRHRESGFDRA